MVKIIYGENHSGELIGFKENKVMMDKINIDLHNIFAKLNIKNFYISGRIKDAGMMKGKISRAETEMDKKCLEYEIIGFKIIVEQIGELYRLKNELTEENSIIKDYIKNPRLDDLVFNDPEDLKYRALHIYTKKFYNSPIEIQMETLVMAGEHARLRQKHGLVYWKTEGFKEKKMELGDNR